MFCTSFTMELASFCNNMIVTHWTLQYNSDSLEHTFLSFLHYPIKLGLRLQQRLGITKGLLVVKAPKHLSTWKL